MSGSTPHEHSHGHGHGRRGLLRKLAHVVVPHSHDASEAIQSAGQARGLGIRAAWIGLAGMAATAILQMVNVAVSGSIGLLAADCTTSVTRSPPFRW